MPRIRKCLAQQEPTKKTSSATKCRACARTHASSVVAPRSKSDPSSHQSHAKVYPAPPASYPSCLFRHAQLHA
uniref:Uncharacterized protein n=1 Tax=Globisporangium ultimum (strain ATCC 200006 / CBS 805.95 / DAOM BR144) TaxID=431595 RepID=K3W9P2_GLOUD